MSFRFTEQPRQLNKSELVPWPNDICGDARYSLTLHEAPNFES
jgi:hypothetical protein